MGFTGAEAVKWKIRYIEAFNALEAAVLEDRASLARESGYLQGLDEGRAATKPEFLAARAEAAARVWRFGLVKKRRLRSAVRYRKMGLGIAAIAKLLDVNNREISELLKAAEDLGFLSTDRPARPVQGNLLALYTLIDGVASGSEQIDRPKGGEAVPVRAKRVTGIESRAKAARSSRLCRVNMDATPEREKEVGA